MHASKSPEESHNPFAAPDSDLNPDSYKGRFVAGKGLGFVLPLLRFKCLEATTENRNNPHFFFYNEWRSWGRVISIIAEKNSIGGMPFAGDLGQVRDRHTEPGEFDVIQWKSINIDHPSLIPPALTPEEIEKAQSVCLEIEKVSKKFAQLVGEYEKKYPLHYGSYDMEIRAQKIAGDAKLMAECLTQKPPHTLDRVAYQSSRDLGSNYESENIDYYLHQGLFYPAAESDKQETERAEIKKITGELKQLSESNKALLQKVQWHALYKQAERGLNQERIR